MIMQFASDSALASASGGIMGYATGRKRLAYNAGIALVIAVVAVSLAACRGGAEVGAYWQSFVPEDAADFSVINYAAILEFEEIPALITDLLGVDSDGTEQWKDKVRDIIGASLENYPGLFGTQNAEDITLLMESGRPLRDIALGNFQFDAIRDALESEFGEAATYRGFEIWDVPYDKDVALWEDRGVAIHGYELETEFLQALDTGRGTIAAVKSDSGKGWALKQAIDKAGDGLYIWGSTYCADSSAITATADLFRSCDAYAAAAKGGNPDVTRVRKVYVFSGERTAAAAPEEIVAALAEFEQNNNVEIEFNIESIEADGRFVTVEITAPKGSFRYVHFLF